ncbi:hypothetical protein FYK55_05265 [Roseiconus nitratireducens]|uniref:Uncharacterized protein n=1 Tax=Roseiconus nitratireducens TaxID=2605748 RepID=A0A5M6DLR0_9BACT|nr:hypothetical protein [Roseiconus nitratireducens]KAA5546295.1 hypothetical protein FYK55_05265 [Roseiconus nitratireducens]
MVASANDAPAIDRADVDTERSSGMTLWHAKRWGAVIQRKDEPATFIELSRPFALIGTHKRCDIALPERNLSSVVYLAVASGSRIEVWPTCPLAFGMWGRVTGQDELLVGKSHVRLINEDDPEWQERIRQLNRVQVSKTSDSAIQRRTDSPERSSLAGPHSKLDESTGAADDWARSELHATTPKSRPSTSAHSEPTSQTLMPDDEEESNDDDFESDNAEPVIQPHSVPAPGQAKDADPGSWEPSANLILDWGSNIKMKTLRRSVSILGNDHPSTMRLRGRDLNRCECAVICFGPRVWIVELHPEQMAANDELIRELLPGDPSLMVGSIHVWVTQDQRVKPKLLRRSPHRLPGSGNAAAEPPPMVRPVPTAVSQPLLSETIAKAAMVTASPEAGAELESLTGTVTDRLLATTQRKSRRQRAIRIVAVTALALLAVGIVASILLFGLIPLIRSIYQ